MILRFCRLYLVLVLALWAQFSFSSDELFGDVSAEIQISTGSVSQKACAALMARSKNTTVRQSSQNIDEDVLAVFNKLSRSMVRLKGDKDEIVQAFNNFATEKSPATRNQLISSLSGVMINQVKYFLPYLKNPDEVIEIFQELYTIYSEKFQKLAERPNNASMSGDASPGLALSAIYYAVLSVDVSISQFVLDNYISTAQFLQLVSHPLRKELMAMLRDPDYGASPTPTSEDTKLDSDVTFFNDILNMVESGQPLAEDILFSDSGYTAQIAERELVAEVMFKEFISHVRGKVEDLRAKDPEQYRARIIILENYFLSPNRPSTQEIADLSRVTVGRVNQLVKESRTEFRKWLITRYPERHGYIWPSLVFSAPKVRRGSAVSRPSSSFFRSSSFWDVL